MSENEEERSSGKIRGGSYWRAFPRYAFMASVSNFTCNNETRRDSPYKGASDEGGKADVSTRWASMVERAMIEREIGEERDR